MGISPPPPVIKALKVGGLLVSPGKAYKILTNYQITGKPLRRSEPPKDKWFKSNHQYI